MSASTSPSLVTIVVTSYNDGNFLHESVGSALDAIEATVTAHVELLVVDDGSTDARTIQVLNRLQRCGVVVSFEGHNGLAATRNTAISAITSDWYIPLDADNRIRPNMVDVLLQAATSSSAAVYGDAQRFGSQTGRWRMGPTDPDRLRVANHIDSCALIRRSAWQAVGGYDADLPGLEDWDLWNKLLQASYELTYLPQIVFDYRVRDHSLLSHLAGPWFHRVISTIRDRAEFDGVIEVST
jgi:glycosyltransferase involved in cell wall biosynthesis